MKSYEIKKIICYVIFVIASIALGCAAYAGAGVVKSVNTTDSYTSRIEDNMFFAWQRIDSSYKYNELKNTYDSNAGEGYLTLSELGKIYKDSNNLFSSVIDFTNSDEFNNIGNSDYYYPDNIYILEYYEYFMGKCFTTAIENNSMDVTKQRLYVLNKFIDFIGNDYISENSCESSVDSIVEECEFYNNAISVISSYYYQIDNDDEDDENFLYNIKITDLATGKESVYENGYEAEEEYSQYINININKDDYTVGDIVGFENERIKSKIDSAIEYDMSLFQEICETYNLDMEVNFAVDVNGANDSYLKSAYEGVIDSIDIAEWVKNISIVVIIASIALIITFICLTIMAGHKCNKDVPAAINADKVIFAAWLVLGALVSGVISGVAAIAALYLERYGNLPSNIFMELFESDWLIGIVAVVACVVVFNVCFIIYLSFVRRVKTKTFWKTTLIGKIFSYIKKIAGELKKLVLMLIENKKASVNTLIFAGAFYIVNFIGLILIFVAGSSYDWGIAFFITLLWIIINAAVVVSVWRYMREINLIEEGTKQLCIGNQNYKMTDEFLYPSNKRIVQNINNIGDGISKAVEKSMKNERMKTDLITNVSHDIKTPLTSIINYVKLLNDEKIDNDKAKKYIKVLDEKSERLKILIDDLVEASKLSSGTIELSMSDINIVELIIQATGEFEEKFSARDLEVITDIKEQQIIAHCDGRKIWRVLDNLYGNVCKYAMRGTRVYISVECKDMICISVKNISERQLNFDASELTEHFVRGDVARNTEGSGLGLSIAKSIIERHGGTLEIVLDGDLFKVMIKLPKKN